MVWFNKLEEVLYLFPLIYLKDMDEDIEENIIRFLSIAQGSVNELETHLILSHLYLTE